MQQPIILFNNRQHKVSSIVFHNGKPSYVTSIIDGKTVEFYDTSNKTYLPSDNVFMVELEKVLIFVPSTIKNIYDQLAQRIAEREKRMQQIAVEGFESELPFPKEKRMFDDIKREIIGLLDAAEIVEGHMEVVSDE